MDRAEAIRRIKAWNLDSDDMEVLAVIIPEFTESEDGRIIGNIKKAVEAYWSDEPLDEILAFLEKQKKQKPNILQNAFDKSKKDYTLEEKSKASDYAENILPTSIMYGESEEEYKLHTIIEAAFIAGQKEQKPLSTEETELNSIAFLEQMGYTCIPPGKEQKTVESTALQKAFISSKTDYTLEEKRDASDYAETVLSTSIVYGENEEEYKLHKIIEAAFIAGQKKEQKPVMVQWTGKNLKEVIDFTGKSPKFDEWFKSWKDFEDYVHSHDDILKLFCEDGSHYEVPVGAWIVKTPDGYNIPSRFKFVQKPAEWSEEDEYRLSLLIAMCDDVQEKSLKFSTTYREMQETKDWLLNKLKSLRLQPHWKPSEEQMCHLKKVYESYDFCDGERGALESLYEQLKKLM